MNGWEAFQIYHPLHLHFTTKYDVLKYGKKLPSMKYENFSKRRDVHEFERWAGIVNQKERFGEICLANFAYGNSNWLYEDKHDALDCFSETRKIRKSINTTLEKDLHVLEKFLSGPTPKFNSFNEFVTKTPKGNKPPLLQLVLGKQVSIESVCILDGISDSFIDRWVSLYDDDPMLSHFIFKLQKYRPFCSKLTNPKPLFQEIIENHHGK